MGKYFKQAEFACKCGCGAQLVHLGLVDILDSVRQAVGVPIEITSGVRCYRHNQDVGGKPSSYHIPRTMRVDGSLIDLGLAADFTYQKRSHRQPINILRLQILAEKFSTSPVGVGIYPTWVHLDVRGEHGRSRARWQESFPWPRL